MKKLICVLMVLMLVWGLSLCVSADTNYDPFLSEDFSTLTINGETYHRMDTSYIQYDWDFKRDIPLTDTQQLQLKYASYTIDSTDQIIATVSLQYHDGAVLTADYVKDSYREKLAALLDEETAVGYVEYWSSSVFDTPTKAPIRDFKGTPMVIGKQILEYGDYFWVYGVRDDLEIRSLLGFVWVEDGKFYYASLVENNIRADYIDPYGYESLDGYEITNPALLKQLQENTALYYSDGIGILYDDEFTEVLSIAVLLLVFGILPFGLLILAVILLIRNKGYQRKTWAVTAGLAAGELVVFGVLVVVFMGLISQ